MNHGIEERPKYGVHTNDPKKREGEKTASVDSCPSCGTTLDGKHHCPSCGTKPFEEKRGG